jgi:hypothetical protein
MDEDFSKYNGNDTALRKAQLRLLEMLIEIDKICKTRMSDFIQRNHFSLKLIKVTLFFF